MTRTGSLEGLPVSQTYNDQDAHESSASYMAGLSGVAVRSWVTVALFSGVVSVVLSVFLILGPQGMGWQEFTARQIAHRTGLYASLAWQRLNGTENATHPAFAYYAQRSYTGLSLACEALMKLGLSDGPSGGNVPPGTAGSHWLHSFRFAGLSLGIVVMTLRGIVVGLLAYALSRRKDVALLAVVLAYVVFVQTKVYSNSASYVESGALALYLAIAAMAAAAGRKWWLVVGLWIVHLLVHPTTAVGWSMLYVLGAVWFYNERPGTAGLLRGKVVYAFYGTLPREEPHYSKAVTPPGWIVAAGVLAVLAPTAGGLLAGWAERAGLLPFAGNEAYWALTRTRLSHTTFLFGPRYALPLEYLSLMAASLIGGFALHRRGQVLGRLNIAAGLVAGGIFLLYATCVETEWSVCAAMLLPLRFEAVLSLLLLVTLLYVVLCYDEDMVPVRLWAGLFLGLHLIETPLHPLVWMWGWALGHWYLSVRDIKPVYVRYAVGALGGVLAMTAYLVIAPHGDRSLWFIVGQAESLMWMVPFLVVSFVAIASVRAFSLDRRTVVCTVAAMLVFAACSWFFSVNKTYNVLTNLRAMAYHEPEQSPAREAVDWINTNLHPGTPVLNHWKLRLHYVSHVRGSMTSDLAAYHTYAPHLANDLAAELRQLYGVDVHALKQQCERVEFSDKGWYSLRNAVLAGTRQQTPQWQYVAEWSDLTPCESADIVFENSYLRVYKVDTVTEQHASIASEVHS